MRMHCTDEPTLHILERLYADIAPPPSQTPLQHHNHYSIPIPISPSLCQSCADGAALQGFTVGAGQHGLYMRNFTLPPSWGTAAAGIRVKLRCDGVYSLATIAINGRAVGGHLGGFTPFEVDVTPAVVWGGAANVLSVSVQGASLADTLASGSKWVPTPSHLNMHSPTHSHIHTFTHAHMCIPIHTHHMTHAHKFLCTCTRTNMPILHIPTHHT